MLPASRLIAAPSRAARGLFANGLRGIRRGLAGSLDGGRGGLWLTLPLGAALGERSAPFPYTGRSPSLGLLEALRVLDEAARDARVEGVVLRFSGGLAGWSSALALHRAVDALREAGKRVVAWGERLGTLDYVVAVAADRIWLPESGALELVGLRSEALFVRGLLERLDVKPEVVHVGRYKSAGEFLTRDSMSAEQQQQLEAWQGDVFGELVSKIARGRGLEQQEVREAIDRGPFGSRDAAAARLIDGLLYYDQLEAELPALMPPPGDERAGPRRPQLVEAGDYYLREVVDGGWQPLLRERPRVAYVIASGAIHRGTAMGGIASPALASTCEELRKDRSVRGVVLRLDSPGGDALASDLLHRELELLCREKPVVVCMGDVAASGGYYLAAAADCVFAEAATLTGSIGVVGGKLDLSGLYRRLGIATQAVERGAHAGLHASDRGFTAEERAVVRREMEAVYQTFLERVARGRRLSLEAVEQAAQGRIWSGLHARSIGLVDSLGGPLEALREARGRAGLAEGEAWMLSLYPAHSRWLGLRAMLGLVLLRGRDAGAALLGRRLSR
jgi:protease-4